MNAQLLYILRDEKPIPANVWYCSQCRRVSLDEGTATKCCAPVHCACGAVVETRYCIECDACRIKKIRDLEAARYAAAEKLKKFDGPLYVEAGREFYEDVNALLDDLGDSSPALTFAWCCKEIPVVNLSADDIIENATQEAYEGFEVDDLHGVAELEAACAAFNSANKGFVNWEVDFGRVLLLEGE